MRNLLAVMMVASLVATACGGELLPVWQFAREVAPQRPTHFIPRLSANSALVIDGKLDDARWKEGLAFARFFNEAGQLPATTLRLGCDEKYLYLGFMCVKNGRAAPGKGTPGARDEMLWGLDCVDIKIKTPKGPAQIMVSPNGAWSDALGGDLAWNPELKVATSEDAQAWYVEIQLKLEELSIASPPDGQSLRMSIGRAGPQEVIQTLSKPYGSLEEAPLFVFGTPSAFQKQNDKQDGAHAMEIRFLMDREEYPRFCARGLGRVRIWSTNDAPLSQKLRLAIAVMQGEREIAARVIDPIESPLADFEMDLTQLAVGAYALEARLLDGNEVFKKTTRRLVIQEEPTVIAGKIALTIPAGPAALEAYPQTFGVPFPWGALTSADQVRLVDGAGREIPMQAEVTGRWSRNGHIRWLLIDAVLPMRTTEQKLTLEYGPAVRRATITEALKLDDSAKRVAVNTGPMQFEIPKSRTPGIASLKMTGEMLSAQPLAGPYLIDQAGTLYLGSRDEQPEVVIEATGPIKAQISVSGWHVSEAGQKLGRYVLRYAAYRGLPLIRTDHTFIITADSEKVQYNDIGYALPVSAGSGFFGAPRITPYTLADKNDSAYLIQMDDYRGKIVQGGKFVDEFSRAEGWFNAGNITLSVRDFWQNFPKEFEARAELAIMHFWPGHGEPGWRTGEQLTKRNAYQQGFAHAGKLLDFRIPEEYYPLIERGGYADQAKMVNAMGVSKTHEMMLHAGTANWELARARSVARVFQSNPTVICDPQWVCASKVLGDISPRNVAQHADLEKVIEGTMEAIARGNEEDRDYGMWVFGDTTHFWDWNARRRPISRSYRGGHHNWPRWPWLQYARGGNKGVFDYACRNNRILYDVTYCHHTDEEFSTAPYPRQKLVGGECDYKGFVHWSAGERLDYNSTADTMLTNYYFTGDRRALDTAREHCQAILAENRTPITREGSGRLCSLVAYYALTWDNDVLELLERHVDNYVKDQREDGFIAAEPVLSFWTSAFIDYTDLTRAQRGRVLTTRWADLVSRTDKETRLYPHQQMYSSEIASVLASLSQAYIYTGDMKYLRLAKARANMFTDAVYEGEDPRYVGQPALWEENMPWSWFLSDTGRYAFALDRYGKEVVPTDIKPEPEISSLLRQKIDGKDWWTLHAFIRQDSDQPFTIRLRMPAYGHVAELAQIDGPRQVLRQAAQPPDKDKMETLQLDVPADGAREYAFRLRSTENYTHINLPLATGSDDLREVYPLTVAGQAVQIVGGEWFYFNVPAALPELQWQFLGKTINEVQVRDPAGQLAARQVWVASNGPFTLALPIKGAREGWSLRFRGDQGRNRTVVRNFGSAPMYLGISPAKLFEPSVDQWKWE